MWYDEKRKVDGKSLRGHLRFAVAYWQTEKGKEAVEIPDCNRKSTSIFSGKKSPIT
jgi:xylose isomerase